MVCRNQDVGNRSKNQIEEPDILIFTGAWFVRGIRPGKIPWVKTTKSFYS